MQLVAVSVVKNEADIIESFVRHTRAWVDHHLIFDHDSTDGTREILGALQREGMPLTVYTDDALGNLQQIRSNALARLGVQEFNADWVLPLDADEAICAPDRDALEKALASLPAGGPASYPLLNYYPTAQDDANQANPFLRLQFRNQEKSHTKKLLVPRALILDQSLTVSKGSHAIYRHDAPLADQPLPAGFHLAHFQFRSSAQQAMRIALAELQKLSRGRAHSGVDLHYRLGFQLLAENPELFFEIGRRPAGQLLKAPIQYHGGPLRYTSTGPESSRAIRALLPFLEKLAASHGQLVDRLGTAETDAPAGTAMRRLSPDALEPGSFAGRPGAFSGFEPAEGWQNQEGPVAEAYLPVFHWGLAPTTALRIDAPVAREARLTIEALTYSERQKLSIELNGTPLHQHAFQRVNQRETIACPLPLRPGANQLTLRHSEFLQTTYDPRKLAVIYLSLRVV